MSTPSFFNTIGIEALAEQVLLSRQVTYADRHQIKQAILGGSLTEADHILLNRILYGIRKGILRLAD
ncbi:hypothetical protein [Leptothermofonsia sp. ETS-13]|uniref:hypothetical protein n=1 Tax=Leptothermofonsia sp. ETS-13 TaxID=3035696 RepID=UPI003BA05509